MSSGLDTGQMLMKDMKIVSGSLRLAVSVLYVTLEVRGRRRCYCSTAVLLCTDLCVCMHVCVSVCVCARCRSSYRGRSWRQSFPPSVRETDLICCCWWQSPLLRAKSQSESWLCSATAPPAGSRYKYTTLNTHTLTHSHTHLTLFIFPHSSVTSWNKPKAPPSTSLQSAAPILT